MLKKFKIKCRILHIQAVSGLSDKEKVAAAGLVILPLASGASATLRKNILENVAHISKQKSKFVVGGLVLEMDRQSQVCQNTAGARNALESAIMWLKILHVVAKESGDLITGEVAKKFATIANRLAAAACSFKRFARIIFEGSGEAIFYQILVCSFISESLYLKIGD